MTKAELIAALARLPDHGPILIHRGNLRDAMDGLLFHILRADVADDGPAEDFGMLQIGTEAGRDETDASLSDAQFIDGVCTLAKEMTQNLRLGMPMDGDTPIQVASEFLAQRLDDPPADAQLGIVLATFIAVHRYRMTTPEADHDPDLPYALTPWDRQYGGGGTPT